MIQSLNDLISFIVLILATLYFLRYFIGTLTSHRNDDTPARKRIKMVKNYIDNEEEQWIQF